MQIDVAVVGRGPVQHRPHEPRLELVEQTHGIERDSTLFLQGVIVGVTAEKPLMFPERRLDLDVLRQYGDIVDPQPVGRLALGLQEIFDAVLGHDTRRFLGERSAQVFGALGKFLGHSP